MTPILGPARCTAYAAGEWAQGRGAPGWWADLADTFWEVAWVLGVRADVAYAQACKETGFGRFGGVIDASFHNTCGLKTREGGANDDPDAHARFPDWRTGIRAHVEHLHLYADRPVEPHVDPRHFPHLAGLAPTVEELSGNWAPSATYHESIVAYVKEMAAVGSITIVSRDQWGARPPDYRNAIDTPTPELWFHHFASEHHGTAGMRQIQAYHMDTKGWSDIAYNFCVDDDGTIYEGRGAGIAGGHTRGRNTISHAICAMGNLDARQPKRAQVEAIARLAAHGHRQGWWPDQFTGGHRQAPGATTACPGRHGMAALPDINALAAQYLAGAPTPTTEDDEMFDEIVRLHEFYLGAPAEKRPRQWNADLRKSLDWHYAHYAGGRPLVDIVGDFRSTAGYA